MSGHDHLHEHAGHADSGLWSETWEILTDPAHLIAEVTFSVLDVLIFGILVPLVWSLARRKNRREIEAIVDKRVRAEHLAIDREHGVIHVDHDHEHDPTLSEESR